MEILQIITALAACVAAACGVYGLASTWQRDPAKANRSVLVDTSALIDGRLLSVAEAGFIDRTLVIPRSVIGELQFLADNADHDKRARARYGLDVVSDLQKLDTVTVTILQDGTKAAEGVDDRLLSLAKQYNAAICTVDYNLNKVAQVEGTQVLNVNDLSKNLRMAYLPGERTMIELVQKGQDSHQAVGHLPDGTMVVVEQASKHIGQTQEVEFIRSIQTAAGKMMFARRVEAAHKKDNHTGSSRAGGRKPVAKSAAPTSEAGSHRTAAKSSKTGDEASRRSRPGAAEATDTNNQPVVTTPPTPAVTKPRRAYHAVPRKRPAAQAGDQVPAAHANPKPSAPLLPTAAATSPDTKLKQPDQTRSSKSQQPTTRRRAPRPKTSAQREASLIDLVNSQAE